MPPPYRYAALSNYLRGELLRRGEAGTMPYLLRGDSNLDLKQGRGRDEYRPEGGAAGAARAAAARAAADLGGDDGAAWDARAAASVERLREAIQACNRRIAPLVEKEGAHVNQYWGYISRAGWADKSHLMRQIEKYADIYLTLPTNH